MSQEETNKRKRKRLLTEQSTNLPKVHRQAEKTTTNSKRGERNE